MRLLGVIAALAALAAAALRWGHDSRDGVATNRANHTLPI